MDGEGASVSSQDGRSEDGGVKVLAQKRRSARLATKKKTAGQRSSAYSNKTTRTTSSVVIARELKLQEMREAAALEEKVEAATREIELLEFDVKFCMDRLETVKARQVPPEEQAEWKILIDGIQEDIEKKVHEIGDKRIRLKYLGKHVEREQTFIQEQAEINRLREDEEEDNLSQDLSEDEVPEGDFEDCFSAFSNLDQRAQSPSLRTREFINTLTDIPVQDSAPKVEPPKAEQPPTESNVAQLDATANVMSSLAAALTEAFRTAAGGGQEKQTKTDKFIARQSIKQDLSPFDGNPEEWPIFINQYRTVSEACGLTAVENLQRLQRGLKGEARECVKALLLSPDNVEKIVDVLGKRYGDPEVVVQRLVKQAQQLTFVKEGDYGGILKFADVVRNLAATAVSMNCTPFLTNPQLLNELVSKLPVPLQVDWTKEKRRSSKTFADLRDFAAWLEDLSEVYVKLHQPSSSKRSSFLEHQQKGRTGRVLVTTEEKTAKRPTEKKDRKCLFCREGQHFIADCKKFPFLTAEERWKWVREKGHCFSCLQFGHSVGKCFTKKECSVNGCGRMHHRLLHQMRDPEPPTVAVETLSHATVAADSREPSQINLMVVPVVLRGPAGEVSTFAMLDTGSTVTLIEEILAERLGLEGTWKELSFKGLHPTVHHKESRVVNADVRGQQEKVFQRLKGARTIATLPLPYQSVKRKTLKKWNHLRNLKIETFEDGRPKLLIGQDNVDLILARRIVSGPSQAPVAVWTKLGWTLCGRVNHHQRGDWTFHILEENKLEEIHQLVKSHMSLESMGVKVTNESLRCKEDKAAQAIMDKTLKRVEGGWEAGLLWKEKDVVLPSSKQAAFNRLLQMERRMDRDPEFRAQYHNKMKEYQDKGFARKLTEEEAAVEDNKTFYLSHFMAINPKKPKKRRFVFDARDKIKGVSLNDKLLTGPDQLTSLPGILMKLRQRKIGMTADIQDMFHRVKLIKEDRGSHRFLWRGDERVKDPDVYEMGVLIFGAKCSPSIAQEVKNRNAREFEHVYPEAVEATLKRYFVDDIAESCDNADEAITRQKQLREIAEAGGFNLCNWSSSSEEVMESIPEHLRAAGHRNLDMDKEVNMERVLGLFWIPGSDIFTFSLNFVKTKEEFLSGSRLPTKREFLALLMTIYDPLGFVANFTVKAKIILQATWRSDVGWDDDIPKSYAEAFQRWLQVLMKIEEFIIPRCYSSYFTSADSIELHIFCDASEEAFGSVAYFRIQKGASVEIAFGSAKSRVAPIKALSIPRLELQAAVLGTRMAEFIREVHDVKMDRTVYWTDSRTVLCWIKSEGKRYQAFVAHRVGEIQESTEPGEWRWVPTAENVADELTRLESPSDFGPDSRWINGPNFLKLSESQWPAIPTKAVAEVPEELLEMKKEYVGAVIEENSPLIDFNKCNSWMKLVRRIAQVVRFGRLCKKGRDGFANGLMMVDIQAAENYLCKSLQQQSFAAELDCVKAGTDLPKESRLKNLSVGVGEDGLLRIQGRLQRAVAVGDNMKSPVILDNKHPLTRLLVHHHHQSGGHHGMERVVNELRQNYHILNIRSAVRSAWTCCQECRNRRALPEPPQMAVLPLERLTAGLSPFTNAGVDYFGPIEVTVARHHEKRYGMLVTCLSTRAVHVEIAHSLTTDSCIMALRRFFGRRGCPAVLWSDNGTNFRGAATELKKALEELDQEKIRDECSRKGVQWKFIPPAAPHMGGSWERLVKSVKVALHSTLYQHYPTDEVLSTLIVEAEHIVNSRPLTHVSIDPSDPEALTPNHFLLGRSSNVQRPGRFGEDDLCQRKRWRIAQAMTDIFWTRWVKEYLPSLLHREKWRKKVDPLKEGDVVLEADPKNPRNSWPMGIVMKVFPGSDGQVRVADVKFAGGVLRRPVTRLARLDVRKSEEAVGCFGGEDAAASTRAGDCSRPKREESSSVRFVRAAGGEKGRGMEENKEGMAECDS